MKQKKAIRCEERGYLGLDGRKRLRILIAGGGVGGLVLALAARKRGYDVKVFEGDLSAVRGEGQHRGPIQLLSSALAVLESIDEDVTKRIVEAGCVTGNRINGLADGLSGEWFTKFDLFTPAVTRGLPVTQVICRIALQNILVSALGKDIVNNNSKVVDFVDDSNKVRVILEDGRQYEGDVLVGADGIWSKVRSKLFGAQPAHYSNYTCYSGLTNFLPPYIDTVGYRVFLGSNQYFVAIDVGSGKMQWYAFHEQAPMNGDSPGKKERLLELFGSWCSNVISPEDIQWEGEDPRISRQGGYGGSGQVMGRSVGRDSGPAGGRGRGVTKGQSRKDFPPSQNGIGKNGSDEIQILHTDTLIKEVERVFGASHLDPLEVEKAKKVLKEHEQALTDALARLADISDGESGMRFLETFLHFFY
ncbi:zeaxanthin epoxidase [Actinidia rufa]|uniref:Zeaxanthin epoxidase n=1 Tax=Actinidia rufa TaxID=165716 RepID=A0A7J0FXV4_9ERIC|nr:zeaxanthin epoxidase [Actinidia rufa]